ncbi:hypothetical protein [Streptococcus suis]|nr:hypothetical protein [Streptococcus suis]MCK3930162.1 hypothetical protein [Streptococcus suis]NQL90587.1 hypothetical protein [Streptococcus suis]HEL1697493.1 hypothetical protein [Streptococcus suis]HEL2080074.1 hypothetical protein [Streptococcus suis]HEL2157371.1 hypothetical protein [Streptococcus suis]
MQSWSVANDCIIRMSEKVRLMKLPDNEFRQELDRMTKYCQDNKYKGVTNGI